MLNRIEINRKALLHNAGVFRNLSAGSFLAVIKSNAYGHGLTEAAGILSGTADWFGVNQIEEALEIRSIDKKTPILVMGMNESSLYREISGLGISLVLSSEDSIRELQEISPDVPFHLKVDSGMSRLGFHGKRLENVFSYLEKNPALNWQGIMSHFANVEDVTDQEFSLRQLEKFKNASETAAKLRPSGLIRHIAASASALILPESHLDLCRIGISLYGLWPSHQTRLSAHSLFKENLPELQPVLSWKSSVVHINSVEKGACVGYGCTERVQSRTDIAVIPAGYFEGYERALSGRSSVLIRGQRARLLGRVCMNMIMADVTHIPGVRPGDECVLLGRQGDEEISADELAGLTHTINYEVVTRIQKDIPRIITEG